MKLIDKSFFRLRERVCSLIIGQLRRAYYKIQGMNVGTGTKLPACLVTWPHKVKIGSGCVLEEGVFYKHDGIWSEGKSIVIGDRVFVGRFVEFNIRKGIRIGDDSLVASGCKFIDHNHGFRDLSVPMNIQAQEEEEIVLEENVWLGVGVVVLKGVRISRGAIVGAGSVVTKNIPENEIWAGIPARKIGSR
ncbi:MAG: DapH/DapD/GlmU-related protein [Opitutaceae bacterium]|jgi:acetyltransferase-like isoleucine patch superfamily enzyme